LRESRTDFKRNTPSITTVSHTDMTQEIHGRCYQPVIH
jgi:hypothetical protein